MGSEACFTARRGDGVAPRAGNPRAWSFYDSESNDGRSHLYDGRGCRRLKRFHLCDSGADSPALAGAGHTLKPSLYGQRRRCLPFPLRASEPCGRAREPGTSVRLTAETGCLATGS